MYIIARTAGGLDLAAIDINPREPWPRKFFFFGSAVLLNYEKIFKVTNFKLQITQKVACLSFIVQLG